MTKLYRLFKLKTKILAFLILVCVALYVIAGRYALSMLPEYKEDIEAYLSEQANHPITIEKITSKWVGFDPVIKLSGITINGGENARIGTISARLATLKSLISFGPRFKSIQLIKSHLAIEQFQKGELSIAGMSLITETSSSGNNDIDQIEQLVKMLDGAEINLFDNSVFVSGRFGGATEAQTRLWHFPDVSMNYRGDHVFASGKVMQPDGKQTALQFALNGHGVLSREAASGELYIEARSSEFLDEVIKAYEWQGMSVQDLDASTRAWIDFDGLEIKSIKGDFQISQMNWKIDKESLPPITNVAGGYIWESLPEGNQLSLSDIGFQWLGVTCESTSAIVQNIQDDLVIYADQLDVGCLSDLALATGWLSHGLHSRIETSRPQGLLKSALFTQKKESDFLFEAELSDVALKAYGGTPSGKGIDGYVMANAEGGSVLFQTDRFELGFPNLYLAPWNMEWAEGNVSWRSTGEEETEVYSDGIRLYMPDKSLVYGDFILRLNPDEHEDYLSLSIALQDMPFEKATSFVPYYQVSHGLYDWLDAALISGLVTDGIYVGYGSVEEGEAVNDFTSSIVLNSHNGTLRFDQNWPELEELSATIHLQNGELDVQASNASIAGTNLVNLHAELPEREGVEPLMLRAKADVTAGKAELDYWLKESPISGQTKAVAEQLVIEGDVAVGVDLSIPVDSYGELDYEITSTLTENSIHHLLSDLPFKEVNGVLTVSAEKGIYTDNVTSTLFGRAAKLSVSQALESPVFLGKEWVFEGGKALYQKDLVGYDVNLSLDSHMELAALLQHYELDPIPALSGGFDFTASVKLPADPGLVPRVNIQSDSQGIIRAWPFPFGKAESEQEQFSLDLDIREQELVIAASITKPGMPAVESDIVFQDKTLSFAEVRLGGAEAPKRIANALSISGELSEIELEPWIDFVGSFVSEKGNQEDADLLQYLVLNVDELSAYGYAFNDLHAEMGPDGPTWSIDLLSDMITGNIRLAHEGAPLTIDLESVVFPKALPGEKSAAEPLFSPSSLPALSFSTDKLIYGGRPLGSWQALIEPYEDGAYLRNLNGALAKNTFAGQLNWQDQNDTMSSILTMDVKGGDIDKIIRSFGWPKTLDSKKLNAELALVWPGSPNDFELSRLSGKVNLKAEEGILNTSDSTTGFLRVFGILNAETILRRLKFDFSDLYESGLSYDELKLQATIDNGQLKLDKPLTIEGPSSAYEIEGKADLAKRELDMEMRVELPITQNVPLAALMLGAPQVGGAVWLVDKLLGEPLSDITSARYGISGKWDDPKVDLKEAANAGRKSKLN